MLLFRMVPLAQSRNFKVSSTCAKGTYYLAQPGEISLQDDIGGPLLLHAMAPLEEEELSITISCCGSS